jgi:hypothetical protein
MSNLSERVPKILFTLVVATAALGCPCGLLHAALSRESDKESSNDGKKHLGPIAIENAMLRITVDPENGAILGITNRKTNTQYLAPRKDAKPPFVIDTYSANQGIYIRDPFEKQTGGYSLYDPAAPAGPKGDLTHVRDPLPAGTRVVPEKVGAESRITCSYQLPDGIVVTYSILLLDDSPWTQWRVRVENRGGKTHAQDQRVYRVAFPVLEGLRIGDRHESNLLARPYAQGELIPDPAHCEFMRPKSRNPIHVLTYIGWASMSWQDLYDIQGGGLYLASYDPSFQQVDLESWPDRAAGTITLDMRTLAFLEPGKAWSSQPFEIGVHEGDWHAGADRYRQWAHEHHHPFDGPQWVRKDCDGWLGAGAATPSYADYLKMFDDARWLGLDYLQIWSQMLEKVGPGKTRKMYYCFPCPDPGRGGEAELTRVVRAIRARGGHIGFYHNLWTWDSEMESSLQQWRDQLPGDVHVPAWYGESRRWASVFPDGSRIVGDYSHGFSGLCPAAKGYQDYLLGWIVDRYVKRYGVDTWYFDSMPVTMFSASRVCFSDEHGPCQPHGVGRGIIELLQRLREAARPYGDLAITSETISDALMQYNSHALGVELLAGLTRYPHPEIYTYTFPEHAIFSGTCNGAGRGLHYYYPDLDKPRREDTFNRVFLMGYRFDILTWRLNRRDPQNQYLRRLIALRQQLKADLYASDFRDEIGLGPLPAKVYAKLFRRRDGGSLTVNLVDRREGQGASFAWTIDLAKHDFSKPASATLYEFDGRQTPLTMHVQQGRLALQIPKLTAEVAAIIVRGTPGAENR